LRDNTGDWQGSRHVSLCIMPGFHHSVAVLALPLLKFRKNYVACVKNSVAPLPFPPAVAQ